MKVEKEGVLGCPYPHVLIGLVLITIILLGVSITRTIEVNTAGTIRDTISVSGDAELKYSPDQALAYISVVTDNMDARSAQEETSRIGNVVIEAIKKWGASPSDIETTSYSLTKRQEWDPVQNKYIDMGYRATHTLKVTTTRINEIGSLVDAAVAAGANGVDSVTFTLTKESEQKAKEETLKKAVEVAKQKAQALATTSGVSLGKVLVIQEQSFIYRPFEFMKSAEAGVPAQTQILPQNVEVSSTIQVMFRIN